MASADKPFRFPATFTFVVRSFTVLDGIGKSLNPRFDISEIAAPYARGLLLEARPQFKKLAEEFRKRASKQARRRAVCLGGVLLTTGNTNAMCLDLQTLLMVSSWAASALLTEMWHWSERRTGRCATCSRGPT